MRIEDVLKSRYGRIVRGRLTQCLCPENHAHGDLRPSLVVNPDHTRVKCFAHDCFGGWAGIEKLLQIVDRLSPDEVRHALSDPSALHAPSPTRPSLAQRRLPARTTPIRIIRRYPWQTPANPSQTVWHLRIDPPVTGKFFWAWDPDGKIPCSKSKPCPKLTLWQADQLAQANIIAITEGERDAETINAFAHALDLPGIRATCTPNGANDTDPSYLGALPPHATVILAGQRDQAGQAYMQAWQRLLHEAGRESFLMNLPRETTGKDWTDWAEAGGTAHGWACEILRSLSGKKHALP